MSFNLLTPIYDSLTKLFFGWRWKQVQRSPQAYVESNYKVLIVGGGTGQVLEGINCDVDIHYVEASKTMIDRAKTRNFSETQVAFYHSDYLTWESDIQFDLVIMPFFIDCFDEDTLKMVIARTKSLLSPSGKVCITDFQNASRWKNLQVRLMYLFFRVTTNIKGRRLPDIHHIMKNAGFKMIEEQLFYNRWIFTRVYFCSF